MLIGWCMCVQLSSALGVSEVYIEWRSTWLTKLYAPQPLQQNRIKEGELIAKVEESMVREQRNAAMR
jgi:hypothetical protein